MEVQDEVLDLLFDLTYKVTNFVRNNRHCKDGPRIKDVMLFKTIYKAENHQITNVFYKTTLTAGILILNTVDGEVKISINRGGIEFAGEILRKLKREAK